MTISYTVDQGQAYLDEIDYTGNGSSAPSNTVKFYLEARPDAPKMYVPNFKMTTAKRLKTIEVQANGGLMRAYKLNYAFSVDTSQSLLTSVQLFGKDANIDSSGEIISGTSFPPVEITFSGGEGSFDSTIAGPATVIRSGGTTSNTIPLFPIPTLMATARRTCAHGPLGGFNVI